MRLFDGIGLALLISAAPKCLVPWKQHSFVLFRLLSVFFSWYLITCSYCCFMQ